MANGLFNIGTSGRQLSVLVYAMPGTNLKAVEREIIFALGRHDIHPSSTDAEKELNYRKEKEPWK